MEGWLTPTDPLLAVVRSRAGVSVEARVWLMQSARAWAQGEFLKRDMAEAWDPYKLEREVARLHGRQIAALSVHTNNSATVNGISVRYGERVWTSHVGILLTDSSPEYLHLLLASEEEYGGVFNVADIFELPETFQAPGWKLTL